MPKILATTGLPCMLLGCTYHLLLLDGGSLYLVKHVAGQGEQGRVAIRVSDFRKKIHVLIKEYGERLS
jgi:hypothetical protein